MSDDWWTAAKLSDAQYIPLLVLGAVSSTLSIMGSSCIIYMTHKDLSNKIMHQLLFALSLTDVIASLSFLLNPFLVPSYFDLPGAIGSHQSCAAIAFLWMSAITVACFYNCYLSIYYLLVVRWSFRERDFKKWWEILAHSLAILIPLAINFAALATQSLNPVPILSGGTCSYSVIPWGCAEEEEDCQRSSANNVESILIATAIVHILLAITSFICTFLVWRSVSNAIRRSTAYRFEGDRDEHSDERLKEVSKQAILYSLAYLNTIFWAVAIVGISQSVPTGELDQTKENPGYYVLSVFFCAFYPLQGAMNFFIFARLKVQQWRKVEPDRSLFWIYSQVIQSKLPTKTKRRTNTTMRNTTNTRRSSAAKEEEGTAHEQGDIEVCQSTEESFKNEEAQN